LLPINLGNENKLVVIPDGELAFVPFDILRCEGKYLFEQKILQMQFHHNKIVNNSQPSKKLSIYCLSPTYEKPKLPLLASLERGEFNYLHYAKKEVGLLKELFGRRIEIDSLSTIEKLKYKIQNSHIFHFSGHAVVDRDSAFLLLSDEKENIFKLYQDQIAYMSNELEMVTLSACETGLGKYQSGEGVISLAASFLNSGSKSIVYSLWNAHDASTSEVMRLYYENLKNGLAKDEALNKAKKEFLVIAPPDQRHPYYWAAFVVAGEMSPIKFRSNSSYWYITLFILLVILGYFFFKNKTKQK
jgi:CHAT domain-containing protein